MITLPPSKADVGLPPECKVIRLVHSRAAAATIVEVEMPNLALHRLFWRPRGTRFYSLLGSPGERESFEYAVVGEHPTLFACRTEARARDGLLFGRSLGLVRIALESSPLVELDDLSNILPAAAWLVRLLRVDGLGRLEAIVGFGTEGGGPVSYRVCALDLSSATLTELDTLPGLTY